MKDPSPAANGIISPVPEGSCSLKSLSTSRSSSVVCGISAPTASRYLLLMKAREGLTRQW